MDPEDHPPTITVEVKPNEKPWETRARERYEREQNWKLYVEWKQSRADQNQNDISEKNRRRVVNGDASIHTTKASNGVITEKIIHRDRASGWRFRTFKRWFLRSTDRVRKAFRDNVTIHPRRAWIRFKAWWVDKLVPACRRLRVQTQGLFLRAPNLLMTMLIYVLFPQFWSFWYGAQLILFTLWAVSGLITVVYDTWRSTEPIVVEEEPEVRIKPEPTDLIGEVV